MRRDLLTCFGLPFYRAMIERSGFGADIEAFDAAAGQGDRDGMQSAISTEFLQLLTAVGDDAAVRAGVQRYLDAGVTSPCVGPIGQRSKWLRIVRNFWHGCASMRPMSRLSLLLAALALLAPATASAATPLATPAKDAGAVRADGSRFAVVPTARTLVVFDDVTGQRREYPRPDCPLSAVGGGMALLACHTHHAPAPSWMVDLRSGQTYRTDLWNRVPLDGEWQHGIERLGTHWIELDSIFHTASSWTPSFVNWRTGEVRTSAPTDTVRPFDVNTPDLWVEPCPRLAPLAGRIDAIDGTSVVLRGDVGGLRPQVAFCDTRRSRALAAIGGGGGADPNHSVVGSGRISIRTATEAYVERLRSGKRTALPANAWNVGHTRRYAYFTRDGVPYRTKLR